MGVEQKESSSFPRSVEIVLSIAGVVSMHLVCGAAERTIVAVDFHRWLRVALAIWTGVEEKGSSPFRFSVEIVGSHQQLFETSIAGVWIHRM